MTLPLLHVVMHEPEIPNNTGNIGRTCIAAGCALHLIHPLGFDTSAKALRRAGLDYWPRLGVREHDSWPAYLGAMFGDGAAAARERVWLTSGKGGIPPWEAALAPGDHVVFGRETRGLPDDLLERHTGRLLMLPMMPGERGLNVATAVCAIVYEAVRQFASRGLVRVDDAGRIRRPGE